MAQNSLNPDSESKPIDQPYERKEILAKNHYFDNETVERLMYLYVEGACTDVHLRDQIMASAEELIRQTIKAHNLQQIYPGKDESSIGDLFQVAWVQIESALYKYDARPHCSKCYNNLRPNDSLLSDEFLKVDELLRKVKKCPRCKSRLYREAIYYKGTSKLFNMWSQIARTVILAHIKKENRDKKNGAVFQAHLETKTTPKSCVLDRFLLEAKEIFKYNKDHLIIIATIKELYDEDEKPNEGFITKLVERSRLPRSTIAGFLKMVRLRSNDFTDSPVNEESTSVKRHDSDDSEFDE